MSLSAEQLMTQAHATAGTYSFNALEAFRRMTGFEASDEPQAFATFASGFMVAAAIDFHTATMSGLNRDAPISDLVAVLSRFGGYDG